MKRDHMEGTSFSLASRGAIAFGVVAFPLEHAARVQPVFRPKKLEIWGREHMTEQERASNGEVPTAPPVDDDLLTTVFEWEYDYRDSLEEADLTPTAETEVRVTRKTLEMFARMPKMRTIFLGDGQIGDEEVQSFQDAFPHVEVRMSTAASA